MSAVLETQEPGARYRNALQPPLVRHFELFATAPGGVARLRQLILSLAIQGKLVSQDAHDEPASVLLQRIRTEKERLVEQGKCRRDKGLSAAQHSEQPSLLPPGWAWSRFGELSINRDGERVPVSSSDRENRAKVYDYYGASGVIDKIDGYLFDKTLLLIGEDGANLLNRSTPIAFLAHGKFWVNNHAHVIDTTEDALMQYLALFINAISLEPYVTGTAQPKMNQAKLNGIVVAVPPLAEQSRIVTRVDELMRLCDALAAKGQLEAAQHAQLVQTLLDALTASATPEELAISWRLVATHFDLLLDRTDAIDALEQTILQLAVRGLLVPQDPNDQPASELMQKIRAEKDRLVAEGKIKQDKPWSWLDDDERSIGLPRGWQLAHLDEVSIVIVDCPHSTAKFLEKGLLCIDTNSFKNGLLLPHKLRYVDESTFSDRIARLRPLPGDLVFAREGSVGESLIIPEGVMACLGQRVMLFRFSECVSNEFVRLVITSKGFLDTLLSLHKGIGAKHVNVGDLRAAVVPIPPLAEQRRIVLRVESMRRLCGDLRQHLTARQAAQASLAEALIAELP